MSNSNNLPPGVTLFCEPTLVPAMRALDAPSRSQIATPVSVLSAPAPLMLAQITRHTRNDVLFTLSAAMDQAVQARLVKPETRCDGFANTLVLAALAGSIQPPADAASLHQLLRQKRLAVTDATVASGLDGRAILQNNSLPQPGTLLGAANTVDVVFLLNSGAADIGLIYLTDVKAHPRLAVIAELAAAPQLVAYSAAVNAHAVSPRAQAFLSFLRAPATATTLRHAGLQVAA